MGKVCKVTSLQSHPTNHPYKAFLQTPLQTILTKQYLHYAAPRRLATLQHATLHS